jgi:ATP-binding cassette subfamily C protein CydCD
VKPVDRRLLRRARPVRIFLVALTGIGALDAVLLIVQATLLADLVADLVLRPYAGGSYFDPVAELITVGCGRAALAWVRETCAVRTSTAVKSRLRADLLCHLVGGPARAADRARTGELALLATQGIEALDGYFARYLPQLALAVIVPAVLGIRILTSDPLSAAIIAATLPLVPLFMILIGLRTRDHLAARWATLERLGGHFLEVVAGLPTLVAFGRARGQSAQIRRAAEAHRKATLGTLRVAFLSALALELIALTSVAMVAVAIGLRLADGGLALRTGLMVLICAPEVYLPLRQLGARYHEAADGLGAADRLFTEIAAPHPAPNSAPSPEPNAAPIPVQGKGSGTHSGGGIVPEPALAEIRFEHVRVEREGRDGDVLRETSFALVPGRVTAVTGASGVGKSTLVQLLLGFDRPTSGRVTVDGVDLADLDMRAWRAGIAWVPQRPRLTGATVADAIRLGAPRASGAQVAEAARIAGIDFPLDARLGRDGTALSGGQARRVALARAVLRDAPIVLLDEPTEHLDAAGERAVMAALRPWLVGRTVLLITHRRALLGLCDAVIRLDVPQAVIPAQSTAATETQHAAVAAPTPTPMSEGAAAEKPPRRKASVLGAFGLGAAAAVSAIGLTAASAWLIATSALRPPLLTLQVGIAAVQAFAFGRACLRYAERLAGHDAALRLLADLRVRVYRGLVRRAPAGLSTERGGDLLSTLTADIDAVQDLFLKALLPIVGAGCGVVALFAFDDALSPRCALALSLGVFVAAVLAPAITRFAASRAERRTQAVRARLADGFVDLLNALPDLVAYNAAEQQAAQIAREDRRLSALERRGALASGIGIALVIASAGYTCAATAVAALHAVHVGQLRGPVAAALVLAPLALFELLAGLPDAARAIDRGRQARVRLNRLAEAAPLIPAPSKPIRPAWTTNSVLELDDVDAAWPGARGNVVRGVSLSLRAGEHVALAGPSGAGKSTVAQLVTRGLDPVRGCVRIDGVDLRRTHPDHVRRLVAVFGQDAHLFDASIRENLRVGRPDAAEKELWHALRVVCLDEWIRTLPAGIDTPVGNLGDAVSGGEAQRVALARALLSPAPVLVLDEPTAHLDAATASAVEANLRHELSGRTVLWLRHQDV